MNSEFRTKFLQYLRSRKSNGGFTLIELLVVIIIIGILASIALPTFLNQANKAKLSEAKAYLGAINRGQQAYYLEKWEFADNANFSQLAVGIQTQTRNYQYVLVGGGANSSNVTNQARPMEPSTKAAIGGVFIGSVTGTGEVTAAAIVCQAKEAVAAGGDPGTATFNFGATPVTCPATYDPMQ